MKYNLIPFLEYPLLRDFVYDIYEIRTDEHPVVYTTAPNGIIGITFNLNIPTQLYSMNRWETAPRILIYGLIQKPEVIEVFPHHREIAIGFKPWFMQLFLKEGMDSLSGNLTNAYDIFPSELLDQAFEKLQEATDVRAICDILTSFLTKVINLRKLNKRMVAAAEMISSGEVIKMENLARQFNITSATLRNDFQKGVGISPKELVSLVRIRNAIKGGAESESLTELAYGLGYYDQAHFIHEFKNMMGLTPRQYFSNQKLIFDFYNFGRWQGDSFGIVNP